MGSIIYNIKLQLYLRITSIQIGNLNGEERTGTKMFYQNKILDIFLVKHLSLVQQYCSLYPKDAQIIFIIFMDKSIILFCFCCFMGSFDSICSWLVPLFHLSQAKCFKQGKLGHLYLFYIFISKQKKYRKQCNRCFPSCLLLLSSGLNFLFPKVYLFVVL